MEDRFSWSRSVVLWLLAVMVLGLLAVIAEGRDGSFPGLWLIFAGAGLAFVSGLIGSARTSSWFMWQKEVGPTNFEAILGLTGVVLVACPLLVISFRIVTLHFTQG